ncbi:hypothetical protein BY996DRAFT_4592819 [Phakopsora pachyrhizi]|nr:hypothetical protein BY996DRAFT_4597567 [Phakopsora pachyrhizi]KAI8447621.1 hypothetical protein BY996DRAFT_4592819 [Phakopsora pachyrhizi]
MYYFSFFYIFLLSSLMRYLVIGSSSSDECDSGKISPDTWKEKKIDEQLANFPSGKKLSLEAFASFVGYDGFRCGIGEDCLAGQICSPVKAPYWQVLVAAQEWNFYINRVYQAFSFSVATVKGTMAEMISDLTEPDEVPATIMTADVCLGIYVLTIGLSALLIMPSPMTAVVTPFFRTSLLGGVATYISLPELATYYSSRPQKSEFVTVSQLSTISSEISEWENETHQRINKNLNEIINDKPIVSSGGLNEILANGTFFTNSSMFDTTHIFNNYRKVIQIRSLVSILRSKGAFIIQGESDCDGPGKDGMDIKENHLSWCDSSKKMTKIVFAHGSKIKRKIKGANLIAYKYGYSTKFLTISSLECQKKYGVGADLYKNGTVPMDSSADCLVNLPVCNLTRPGK